MPLNGTDKMTSPTLPALSLPPRYGFFENDQMTAGWTADQMIAFRKEGIAERLAALGDLPNVNVKLIQLLREVTGVAIVQLYETFPEDIKAEFTLAELEAVLEATEPLRPQQVEHIYRRGFDASFPKMPPA